MTETVRSRRILFSIAAAGAALLVISAAGLSATRTGPAPPGIRPLAIVSCNSVIDQRADPYPGGETIFGRVALWPRGTVIPMHYFSAERPFHYWGKQGLEVKAARGAVDLIVPRAWRNRAALVWGDASARHGASVIRIQGCPLGPYDDPSVPWLAYAGGFFARKPLCLPLVVRVGGKTSLVPVSVGRACPPQR